MVSRSGVTTPNQHDFGEVIVMRGRCNPIIQGITEAKSGAKGLIKYHLINHEKTNEPRSPLDSNQCSVGA
jgi:hypothetical protein